LGSRFPSSSIRVALTALGASPTQTAIDDVWSRFGALYTYDNGGRRTTSTVRPDNTQTNVTRYFYDADDHLRFEVNQLGERKEYRYNALGQLTDEIDYYTRISTSSLAAGGLLTATLLSTLTASADSTRDARSTYTYSLRGERLTSTSAEGALAAQTFNSFGEVKSSTVGAGAEAVTSTFTYTARGQTRTTTRMGTLFETRDYDAFGRLWRVTDGRGKISKTEYDRIGRTIASVDQLGGRSTISYDGYSRTYQTDDATPGANFTTYTYDDTARTMTVDTPEGVRIVTTVNRHQETTSITVGTTAGAVTNSKTFTYDKNGQVLFAYEGGVQVAAHTYDRGGRQVTDVDGRGTTTTIDYDAANRVFHSIVDSVTGGLRPRRPTPTTASVASPTCSTPWASPRTPTTTAMAASSWCRSTRPV